jgi:hypothetical protein
MHIKLTETFYIESDSIDIIELSESVSKKPLNPTKQKAGLLFRHAVLKRSGKTIFVSH